PWKLPLLGSMLHMAGGLPHHVLRDLAKKYGPLMHLQLGEVSAVVVTSPDMAKEGKIMNIHHKVDAIVEDVINEHKKNLAIGKTVVH
ncbi:hypothetical protein HAX54_038779, partial [Datura stramonium]|nr:hypothetical protein [Datura stramonium]